MQRAVAGIERLDNAYEKNGMVTCRVCDGADVAGIAFGKGAAGRYFRADPIVAEAGGLRGGVAAAFDGRSLQAITRSVVRQLESTISAPGMADCGIMKAEDSMTIEEEILEKVRALPEAKKTEVLQYVSGLESAQRIPFRSPEGILADLNFTLTEEDLAEARREMWANFPHDDIA